MRGESEVLDVGRRSRTRHPGPVAGAAPPRPDCRFPGCDRPAEWTDVHHLNPWIDGGRTDLDNLVLSCRYHHVLCHEGGWTLTRTPDGTITATKPDPDRRPNPATPTRTTRLHARRLTRGEATVGSGGSRAGESG